MGERGPAAAPLPLKLMRGDPPSRINSQQPIPTEGRPALPSQLRPLARRFWREIVPKLEHMRVLTIEDRQTLAMYCDSLADYWDADACLRAHGPFIEERDAEGKLRSIVKNPAHTVKNLAFARVYRLGAQFGLMPAARNSILAGPAPDGSDAALLS